MKTLLVIALMLSFAGCSKKETCKKCMTYEVQTGATTVRNDVDKGVLCGDDLERFESVKPVQSSGYQKYNRCQ